MPRLSSDGYDAIGVDPRSPEGTHYQQAPIEHAELPQHVDAVVASTSLHHIADPGEALDRIARTLKSGGKLVVVEWAWERFDEPTAEWCFQRIRAHDEPGWLHRRRDEWLASRDEWSRYLHLWAERENLHAGETLIRLLDERLERQLLTRGPYFFPELADTTEADEQAAIDAGEIQANRIDWVGVVDRGRGASPASSS